MKGGKKQRQKHTAVIQIRLSPELKEAFERRAEQEALSVSAWLRNLGVKAAGNK